VVLLVHQPWRDAERWHRLGLWQDTTLPDLLNANAAKDPDGPAYVQGELVLSWAGLRDATALLAHQLLEAGCRPADIVVVVLNDGPELVAMMAAAQAIGVVAAPMSSASGESEVAAIVERVRAAVVVTDRPLTLPGQVRVVEPGPIAGWPVAGQPLPPEGCVPDPDAVADLMFTSGTTGRPKGVMNTANTKFTGLRGLLEVYPFGHEDVWGVIPPMSHNAGWLYTALPALATGAPLVAVGRGDAVRMLDTLERHRVTATFLVPTHMSDLVTAYRREPGRWRLSLRHVITGAAPSQDAVLRAAVEEWGITPISMYGMTECQGNLFTRPDDPIEVITQTVGRACPGSAVALRDPASGELVRGDGGTGEVVTRGPTTFVGYYDDQGATSASFTADGWFRSGDIGLWVGDSIRIVGRVKEVILRGGQTISPDEVELAFVDVEGIGEVVAVALPDERLGERVCLGVTGIAPGEEALRAHLTARGLSRHLLPDEVRHLAALPRTGLGKAKRSEIRSLLLAVGEPASTV
jgi:acyl-CoA synthetase